MAWTRLELRDRAAPPQAASTTPIGLWTILALAVAIVAIWLSIRAGADAQKPPDATFRAEEHLAAAVVTVRKPGAPEQPCTYQASDSRWHCGAQDFAFVGAYAGLAAGKPIYLIADPAELPRAHDALADYHLAIVWPQCQQFDTNILGTYQWCPLTRKT